MTGNNSDADGSGLGKSQKQLDDLSSSQIGKRLKSMYDEVVSEPVPDKFMDLLASLEQAEKGRSHD